ncbi:ATP-binding protein [Azospirillum sp. Sh1]|uniref:AAA family ATPase n=1 Tax=Azospirillum sp. Sh1 TaxID=2607285 RepID=UPI00165E3260|nr:ATP-binding protein [Azospirillum sp. Sh1]
MLLRFACSNFRSIKEKQEILFTAAKHVKEHDEAARTVDGLSKERVLPVVALYGANASGKSNMLKALEFFQRGVLFSQFEWNSGINRQPFLLDFALKDQASSFEIDFLVGGVRYHYGFVCDDKAVLEEWLIATSKSGPRVWLHRDAEGTSQYRGKIRDQGQAIKKAGFERENVLALTLLMQGKNSEMEGIHNFFSRKIDFNYPDQESDETLSLAYDEAIWSDVNKLLANADSGIEDIKIERTTSTYFNVFDESKNSTSYRQEPIFRHTMAKPDDYFKKNQESHGTIRLFNLSGPALMALRTGSCLCIDELDASLHTMLSRAIIRLFMDPKTNPKGAQLLFTTHDTNLLSTDVLRRDQVWLTEKDKGGATHCYPLSDFKTKPTDDIEAGYLAGRFGAIPFLPPWRSLIGGEG